MGSFLAETLSESQTTCHHAIELASSLLNHGQATSALLQAKNALDSDSSDPTAWLIFAKALRAIGELDACYSCAIKGRQVALQSRSTQVCGVANALAAEAMSILELICAGVGKNMEKRAKDSEERDRMCLGKVEEAPVRILALSDLHVDQGCNMDYIEEMHSQAFKDDVLIVAGDVADTFNATVHALKILKSKFMRVFYIEGNHCLWNKETHPDSIAKLLALMDACDKIGVDVSAGQVAPQVFVVPMHSWYHYSFDTVPVPGRFRFDSFCSFPVDEQEGVWQLFLAFNRPAIAWTRKQLSLISDRKGEASPDDGQFKQSSRLSSSGESKSNDGVNANLSKQDEGLTLQPCNENGDKAVSGPHVITFSHFLPRKDLPYSKHVTDLGKAMGCLQLEQQLDLVSSSTHVYGHSHFPADTLLPVGASNSSQKRRYVNNPLDGCAVPVLRCLWDNTKTKPGGCVDFCSGRPL